MTTWGASRDTHGKLRDDPSGGLRRPLGQSLGTRRHDRSEGSPAHAVDTHGTTLRGGDGDPRATHRRPPPRPLREVSQNLSKNSATARHGDVTDHRNTLPRTLPEGLRKTPAGHSASLRHHPPQSPDRPPQHRPLRLSTEPSRAASTGPVSALREGLRGDPAGPLRGLRHHAPQRPDRPPRHLRHVLHGALTDPPRHARSAPSLNAPRTTSTSPRHDPLLRPRRPSTPSGTTLARGPADHLNTLPRGPAETLRPALARPLAPASKTPRYPSPPPSPEAADMLAGASRRALPQPFHGSPEALDQPHHDVSAGPSKTPPTSSATRPRKSQRRLAVPLDRVSRDPPSGSATTPQRGAPWVGDGPPAHPRDRPSARSGCPLLELQIEVLGMSSHDEVERLSPLGVPARERVAKFQYRLSASRANSGSVRAL
jgi:hypothetical protein